MPSNKAKAVKQPPKATSDKPASKVVKAAQTATKASATKKVAKPISKPVAKPAPAKKPAVKAVAVKPIAKSAKKPVAAAKVAPKTVQKTVAKPVVAPKTAPAPKAVAAVAVKPATKPVSKPAPRKLVKTPLPAPVSPRPAPRPVTAIVHPVARPTPAPAPAAPARSAYSVAGVDIDSKMNGVKAIKEMVKSTATRGVIGGIGHFGGLFAAPGEGNILVASSDGVGTKLKVAVMAHRHGTVGQDLVNHCVNDILVLGAKPLFFMDYVGSSRFDGDMFKSVVSGLCKACRENGCALLGGETAELPGLYPVGEYDLVGTIVGVVDKKKIITGKTIKNGDVIIGLPSGGLQTNGYSLARKVLFDQCGFTVNDMLPGTRMTIADALLSIHQSFLRPVEAVMKKVQIQGMAHITGGGFTDNIPRVLPDKCRAVIDRSSWKVPTIFQFLGRQGHVADDEMYRVFNMGIGFVMIVRPADVQKTLAALKANHTSPVVIGKIEKGEKDVVYRDSIA